MPAQNPPDAVPPTARGQAGQAVVHHEFADLPASCRDLFAAAARQSFFHSLPWFESLAGAGIGAIAGISAPAADSAAARLWLYTVGTGASAADGSTMAALVGLETPRRRLAPHTLGVLANYYSCLFAPILAPEEGPPAAQALAGALAATRPRWDLLHLHSLDPQAASTQALTTALRRSGFRTRQYFHFGNWYETTDGMSFEDYLAARPAGLRNTLRRREKRLLKTPAMDFRLICAGAEVEAGIAAYEAVYARSWKHAEPHPAFAATLIRACAAAECLRLGVLSLDGRPAAAQIWIVWHGKATIFKLAHDEAFKALSPGSVLTLWMMRHALEVDRVSEVDYGRGDDPYKRDWLPRRRERVGLLAFNPHTLAGTLLALRHDAGHRLAGIARRFKPVD